MRDAEIVVEDKPQRPMPCFSIAVMVVLIIAMICIATILGSR
jgi:hypothetical protein